MGGINIDIMGRALKRHHEERIKNRWRKRARRSIDWLFDPVPRLLYTLHPEQNPLQLNEEIAVRMAHHSKCPCWGCKRERYNRSQQRRLDKEEIMTSRY